MWQYVAVVVIFYAVRKWYWSSFKGFENIDKMFPGPPTVPIFGNALMFVGDTPSIHKKTIDIGRLYKRSIRLWLFNQLYVVVYKPAEIEAVLNNTVHIKKSNMYDFILPWIGRGLITSYGGKWKKNRKLLTPAFHFKIAEAYLNVFNANADSLCEILKSKIGQSGFVVTDYIKLYALDNIFETAMGVRIDAQHNLDLEVVHAVDRMCQIGIMRAFQPLLFFDFTYNMTKLAKEQERILKTLHSFTRGVIDKRMEQRMETKGDLPSESDERGTRRKQSYFVDILLDMADEGSLTVDEVQNEVDTFMFAGHETITSALSFCIYNLANHPEYQAKAYAEQVEIFNDDPTRSCTPDDISKMKYLEMVVKETLRLYPSVPGIARHLEKNLRLDELSVIPKDVQVIIGINVVHLDREIWEKPLEFYPDHFLPDTAVKRHPYAYLPFSAGPRNCIGMKFAMLEMKCTLSKILRRFHLKPSQPQVELVLMNEITLKSQTGVNISLSQRT